MVDWWSPQLCGSHACDSRLPSFTPIGVWVVSSFRTQPRMFLSATAFLTPAATAGWCRKPTPWTLSYGYFPT